MTAYPDSDAMIRDYAARQRLARIAVEKVMRAMERKPVDMVDYANRLLKGPDIRPTGQEEGEE